jgi:hypothetical protein
MLRIAAVLALCACDAAQTSVLDVDTTSPGNAVPDDFLGLSVEWGNGDGGVARYVGDGNGAMRAPLVTLLASFADEGHCPVLRIGGNSEDDAWWNPNGDPRPANVDIDIGNVEMTTLASYHAAHGCSVILGLNLRLDDPVNASDLVQAARSALPSSAIAAFELGNEPDSQYSDFATYMTRFDAFRDAIATSVDPNLPFEWPALAKSFWLDSVDGALASEKGRVAIVSTHVYPGTVCAGFASPPPIALMGDPATQGIGDLYAPHVAAAHAAGFAFRMGELNSVSCGGGAGTSDVYAAALWGADISLTLATAGVDGVNFHGPGNHYGAFTWNADGTIRVAPLFYGLRLASMVTAKHGRLVPAQIQSTTRVRAFATVGDDGAARVLVLHEDAVPETIRLRFGDSRTTATAVRMHAPSLDATNGITLGGATWDGTPDGALVSSIAEETLARDGDGWRVDLPAWDAVVVTAR